MRITKIAPLMLSLGLFASLLTQVATSPALAHSWYDPDCCGGQDCEMIPVERVKFLGDGRVRMTDAKGSEHVFKLSDLKAMERARYPKSWDDEQAVLDAYKRDRDNDELAQGPYRRASQDGEFHLCLHGGAVRCVYFPAEY